MRFGGTTRGSAPIRIDEYSFAYNNWTRYFTSNRCSYYVVQRNHKPTRLRQLSFVNCDPVRRASFVFNRKLLWSLNSPVNIIGLLICNNGKTIKDISYGFYAKYFASVRSAERWVVEYNLENVLFTKYIMIDFVWLNDILQVCLCKPQRMPSGMSLC